MDVTLREIFVELTLPALVIDVHHLHDFVLIRGILRELVIVRVNCTPLHVCFNTILVIILYSLVESGNALQPLFASSQAAIILLLALRAHTVLAVMLILLCGASNQEQAV